MFLHMWDSVSVSDYPYLSKTGTREIGGTDQSGSSRDHGVTAVRQREQRAEP